MCDKEKVERERLTTLLKDKRRVREVGHKYVCRWQARRAPYFLSIQALKTLDCAAILGRKNGTDGIFYPIEDIRVLANENAWIPPSHISERRITKQMKAGSFDLEELRQHGTLGKKKGQQGPPHYFYSEEVIVNELAIEVIPSQWVEGKDYVLMTRYPERQDDLLTRFAIHNSGLFRPAAYYFWGEEAVSQLTDGNAGRPRRSQRKEESVPSDQESDDENLEDQLKKDLEAEIRDIKREITSLEKLLSKKEYRLKNWGKEPIYTDSD